MKENEECQQKNDTLLSPEEAEEIMPQSDLDYLLNFNEIDEIESREAKGFLTKGEREKKIMSIAAFFMCLRHCEEDLPAYQHYFQRGKPNLSICFDSERAFLKMLKRSVGVETVTSDDSDPLDRTITFCGKDWQWGTDSTTFWDECDRIRFKMITNISKALYRKKKIPSSQNVHDMLASSFYKWRDRGDREQNCCQQLAIRRYVKR